MDSGSWARVKIKETESTPWNLVHHSAFKLDKGNIGVLWYDYNVNDSNEVNKLRIMRMSILDLESVSWKEVKLQGLSEVPFRFGLSAIP